MNSNESPKEKQVEEERSIPCGWCKGSGTVWTTWTVCTPGKPDEVSERDSSCRWCHGHGTMTQEESDFSDFYDSVWCECKEDHGSHHIPKVLSEFFNDTYYCKECGKVTQFG